VRRRRGTQGIVAESYRPVANDVREASAPDSAHFIPEETHAS